jgi:long-chain acyl-CoA synthetase
MTASSDTSAATVTKESFWQRAPRLSDKAAVVNPDGSVATYAALAEASNRVANLLVDRGLRDGDCVAVALPNSNVIYEVFSATLQAGLYFTPINWHLNQDEIAYILRDSAARVVVTDAAFADLVGGAAQSAGMSPQDVLIVGGGSRLGSASYEAAKAAASALPPPARRPGQRLYYTSGTTGKPKAVLKPRPEGDADEQAVRFSTNLFGHSGMGSYEGGVHLVTGPTYHPSPLGFGMAALHFGQTVVLMGKWSPDDTLTLIEKHRVTDAHFVPTMFQRLMRLPVDVRARADISSLRNVVHAAAPCPPELKKQIMDWWGPIVWEYYSSSEIGGTVVSPQEWLARPGTVGRAYAGAALRILDDDGGDQPVGEPGLVYFKIAVPFEYKGDPDKTATARRHDDWATVGDIGFVDDEGYLFLCDRQAETIISGGVNIYPAEIEAALLAHPQVQDVAVIGVPDPEWGESVTAVVQLAPHAAASSELADELLEWAGARVARFKRPKSVDFVDELPRGDNGKLLRRLVRDPYWQGSDRKI